ncbi:von Hippel-Lindau disease tumor suppressor [Labeo rohita]|uniref:von Hippel-Lindau disease tumor suppressor n=1 Tax=Labeo rohita TaxID=84645 RepID=A0ABQ8MRJ2_LABRO|nr:von Hippel-Lindau-like protein [Labeo rohita]KAI2665454.1 von Hippel-Lindau disease tumor suppressor [Labeo rohita]
MAEQEMPAPLKSLNSDNPTFISFINRSNRNAEAWWLDFKGEPVSYGDIQPRTSLKMRTYLTHPWIFRASDGAKLLANLSEVYFPTPVQYDEFGYPRYQPVYVTAPVYSLQEYCIRLIRSLVRKEDIRKLEIPEGLRKDLRREPDLVRDIQILSAKRSINGSK